MIKIRYRDQNELSPGLHAAAECHGRETTVYLLCGLPRAQRGSARRRLRLSARMGHCPRLPAVQLALALCADRIGTGVGRAGAVFRSHPAGSTVPVMVVSAGAIAFLMLSTVSIRVPHPPRVIDEPPAAVFTAPIISGFRAGVGSIIVTGTISTIRGGTTGRGHPDQGLAPPPAPVFPGPATGAPEPAAWFRWGSACICGCPAVPLR
jgi:hypothetical protein